MSKFKVNDVVLYQNGERFELGIVKDIVEKDSGQTCYRVWYHTGDTTALTDEHLLHAVANQYAFTILRRQASSDCTDSPLTCRKVATELLGQFELYGDMYYQLEDWLTARLEGQNPDIPLGVEGEYLRCALRIEVRDFFDSKDAIDIESDDIEECVDRIINHFSINVLDVEFINDVVDAYIEEQNFNNYINDVDIDDLTN